VQIEQPTFSKGSHHVSPGGKVIEERAVGDIGVCADVFDRGVGNTLAKEQLERCAQDPLPDFLLAAFGPVHPDTHVCISALAYIDAF